MVYFLYVSLHTKKNITASDKLSAVRLGKQRLCLWFQTHESRSHTRSMCRKSTAEDTRELTTDRVVIRGRQQRLKEGCQCIAKEWLLRHQILRH